MPNALTRALRIAGSVLPAAALWVTVLAQERVALSREVESAESRETRTEQLTGSMISVNGRLRTAAGIERGRLSQELRWIAAERRSNMEALVEENPGEFLRLAVPAGVRENLPANARVDVEEEAVLEGTVETLYEDSETGSRVIHRLWTNDDVVSLHFASEEPTDLHTDTEVRVRGVRIGQAMALSSGKESASVQYLTSVAPNTFGEQRTAVILVNFQGSASQPYTLDYARNVVFGTTSNFYKENTQNQTWLTGNVFGWYTIPMDGSTCDYYAIASYAKQAAQAAGVNLGEYRRFIYGFPKMSCSWWGMGNVGGNPSNLWVNGSFTLKVVGHELGHNFGLYHSRTTANEYGDTLDIMGNPSSGHMNAFQKERLGWLSYGASPPITTVGAMGDHFIDPYSAATANPKALKILKSTDSSGRKTWYYVEHRRGIGFDSFVSSNGNVLNGIVVHTGSEASPDSSYLLDMTPETSTWNDPALTVGSSFYDASAGVTITPISVGASGATVNVKFAAKPCVRGNPVLVVSPASRWGLPGSKQGYAVSVTNADSEGCSASSFSLSSSPPAGWSSTYDSPALSVGPGATASTNLWVASPASTPDGLFKVAVKTARSGELTAASSSDATYVVSSGLNVVASTDRSAYATNQSVSVKVSVSAGGVPSVGARVLLTVTRSNGSKTTMSSTTATGGSAVLKFRINKKDPVGTYALQVDATDANGLAGKAVLSILVE